MLEDLAAALTTINEMSAANTRLQNMYNLAMGALAKAEQARCRAPYTDEHGEHSCEPPECRATQPSTGAVERAREIVEAFPSYTFDRQHTEVLVKEVATALTAARREERELRALDEAVRAVDEAWVKFSEHGIQDARLITALYARLDELHLAKQPPPGFV